MRKLKIFIEQQNTSPPYRRSLRRGAMPSRALPIYLLDDYSDPPSADNDEAKRDFDSIREELFALFRKKYEESVAAEVDQNRPSS